MTMFTVRAAASAAFWLFIATQPQLASAQVAGVQGCFSSAGQLTDLGSNPTRTSLNCQMQCQKAGATVLAVKQKDCYCGSLLPPADDKVSDSQCDYPCDGYPAENCGGDNAWLVYLVDPSSSVGNSPDDGSSAGVSGGGDSDSSSSPSKTPTPTTSKKPSVIETPATVTVGGKVSVITVVNTSDGSMPTQSPDLSNAQKDDGNGGGSNTGGIVAGVVVGVVALIAIILGTWWLLRKRRARHEGHQRVQSTNAFATAGAGPGTMDTRLDPSMVQRRDSTGSVFADNQDYSRRILRVANPDGR